jgi:hypothetical protein
MREVEELLKQKELQLEALGQEIEALRLTLRLLEQAETANAQNATRAAVRKRTLSLAAGAEQRGERLSSVQASENIHDPASGLEFP